MLTAGLIEKYSFGRCYQTPDQDNEAKFEAPVPAHYNIGTDSQTGTRAMHYHLSIELPQGYHFSPETDVDQNGIFQTQFYFRDDPHAAEDEERFGPNAGFAASRVIPDNGVIEISVKLSPSEQI